MENKQRPIILSTLCKPTKQSITYMNNIAYIQIIWTTGKVQTLRIVVYHVLLKKYLLCINRDNMVGHFGYV